MKTAKQILSEIKSKLSGIKSLRPDSFQACCPAHEDDKASLTVSIGQHNDRVILHCHAGCDYESILDKLGMVKKDLYVGKGKKEIEALYDYLDADGNLKHQTVRFKGKDFKQRRPDGKGDWLWSLQGITPILYRLPDIIACPDKLIYTVEGERDADRLASMGFLATTNPLGAGKWRPQYTETLKGRNVALIADNDEPGRKHIEAVAQSLLGKAASIKVIRLPDLPDKGDVSDWLDNGGTGEALLLFIYRPCQISH